MKDEFKTVLAELIEVKSSSNDKLMLSVDEIYKKGIIDCDYSQEDVQQLINELSENINYGTVQKRNLGILITSFAQQLVKTSEDIVTLDVSKMKFSCLGIYWDVATLNLIGDVGDYLVNKMKGGEVNVIGNVGSYAGAWKIDGESNVYGAAGSQPGIFMEGSPSKFFGEVGAWPGEFMSGGLLELFAVYNSKTGWPGYGKTGGEIIEHNLEFNGQSIEGTYQVLMDNDFVVEAEKIKKFLDGKQLKY